MCRNIWQATQNDVQKIVGTECKARGVKDSKCHDIMQERRSGNYIKQEISISDDRGL